MSDVNAPVNATEMSYFLHSYINAILLLQPFYGPLSGTSRVNQYQKKHSPTYIDPDHQSSFISFLDLLRSIASYLFNLHA